MIRDRTDVYPRCRTPDQRRLRAARPATLRSRISARAGVRVIATTIDATIARVYDSASGRKKAPVRPCSKKTGTAAATMINVA